jgi:hypothetical protein
MLTVLIATLLAATRALEGPNGVDEVDLGGMRNLIAAGRKARVKRIVLITGILPRPAHRYGIRIVAQGDYQASLEELQMRAPARVRRDRHAGAGDCGLGA